MGDRNRIGAMTVAKNDEATIAFVIGAALPHVDHYVYVDTGSTDHSMALINRLFADDITKGKLTCTRMFIETEIWRARETALAHLRGHEIDFFFKLDGDDVCFDHTISTMATSARYLVISEINNVCIPSAELYQYKAETSIEWLTGLMDRSLKFYEMSKHAGQPYSYRCPSRIQNVHGAYAKGNWCDESQGLTPEGIYHRVSRGETLFDSKLSAHYGWARPMKEKRAKAKIRYGEKKDWSERVQDLHLHPHHILRGLVPFHNHPDVFGRLGGQVLEILKETEDAQA